MDGKSSGFISGAASGAVMGSSILPGWGTAIGAVVGGVVGLISGGANDDQMDSQLEWARYNAQQQYNVTQGNIMSQTMLAAFNAGIVQQHAAVESDAARRTASYNAGIIQATTLYNDSLLEEELALLWEEAELDIRLLGMQRARERGDMVAQQAASGTVIGEGSNEAVIIDQMTQEALDTFIVRRGADIQAGKINNQRAQSIWQGEMAIQKTIWDGEMAGYMATTNANFQSAGILAQSAISGAANERSALFQLQSGNAGVNMTESGYSRQNTQNMISGLFSAAGQGVSAYYGSKAIDTGVSSVTSASSNTTFSYGSANMGAGTRNLLTEGLA